MQLYEYECSNVRILQNFTYYLRKTLRLLPTDTFDLIHLLFRNTRNRCLHSSVASDCSRDNVEELDACADTRSSDCQSGRSNACRKVVDNRVDVAGGGGGILVVRKAFHNALGL